LFRCWHRLQAQDIGFSLASFVILPTATKMLAQLACIQPGERVSSTGAGVYTRPLDVELLLASEGALIMDAKSLMPDLSRFIRLAIRFVLGVGDGRSIDDTRGATVAVGGGSCLSQQGEYSTW